LAQVEAARETGIETLKSLPLKPFSVPVPNWAALPMTEI
jgi:hypothetical protein